ncbi:hypothetical protein KR038_002042 [Drosophila bunnanda]|nr:hypothetical protein KR038_002042 [Drosophila bunnanda]
MVEMRLVLLLSLNILLIRPAESFEPLTMTAIGLGIAGSAMYFQCRFKECCDDRSIPGNIRGECSAHIFNGFLLREFLHAALEYSLRERLYGQHIVIKHVVPALEAHFRSKSTSRKPLVISFHGQPGTGKNFVADQIAQALYLKGSTSGYVAKYLGQADFPNANNVNYYKEKVSREVRKQLAECPRSLFIFDEVDKMPSGVFDTLASLADYNAFSDGTDNTKAIFIFLSNTAGKHIADHLGNLMKGGMLREDTRLGDFENLLKKAAYNLDGGLKQTALIDSHVIDHFIPFLPMERAHVFKCLEAEFYRWDRMPWKGTIDKIIKDSISYDRTHNMFAISGCKTLEKKVAMAILS